MNPDVPSEKAKAPRSGLVRDQVQWVLRKPMNLEKLALWVQRMSGVGILVYLFFHIFVTSTAASGRDAWEGVMDVLRNPGAHVGELLVVVGAVFHAINGIRVMLLEMTSLVGKPVRPDYPYKAQSPGEGQQPIPYTATNMGGGRAGAGLATIAGIVWLWGF